MNQTEQKSQSPERRPIDIEISMALQTYEFFSGGQDRQRLLDDFQLGQLPEMVLDYPSLGESVKAIDQHIKNLATLSYTPDRICEVNATPEYRLAEAYFIKELARINTPGYTPEQAEINNLQTMNEEIYGKPDYDITQQVLGLLWEKVDQADSVHTRKLRDELENGFIFVTQDGTKIEVPGLPRPEINDIKELPTLDDEALIWLYKLLTKRLAPAKQAIDEYYQNVVTRKDDKVFTPGDISEVFKIANLAQSIDIDVIEDPNATALSWSSADNAVRIGMKRKPFKTPAELFGVFAHECYVHGGRHIHGIQLGDISLASGLFTEADTEEGEDPSYLTFEEGLASVVQKAVRSKKEDWQVASLGNYINIALASEGWTSRQIFEVMNKVRLALATDSAGTEIDQKLISKIRSDTLTQIVRTFRGTPVDKAYKTSYGKTLHYAKDLAYLIGKVKAIKYINSILDLPEDQREDTWQKLLVGKFDATNRRQKQYAENVLSSDRIKA